MRSEGSRKAGDHRSGAGILDAGCPSPSTSTLWKPCSRLDLHRWKRLEGGRKGFSHRCSGSERKRMTGGGEGGGRGGGGEAGRRGGAERRGAEARRRARWGCRGGAGEARTSSTPSSPVLGILETRKSPLPTDTSARPSVESLTTSTVWSVSGSAPGTFSVKRWNWAIRLLDEDSSPSRVGLSRLRLGGCGWRLGVGVRPERPYFYGSRSWLRFRVGASPLVAV